MPCMEMGKVIARDPVLLRGPWPKGYNSGGFADPPMP